VDELSRLETALTGAIPFALLPPPPTLPPHSVHAPPPPHSPPPPLKHTGEANVDVDELGRLETALTGAILEASLARGEVAAAAAAGRFEAGLSRQAAGKPARATGKDSSSSSSRCERGPGGGPVLCQHIAHSSSTACV
jgi:hypothetical protein